MILYHGSFLVVPSPDLKYSRPNVDFGRGFYTTPIREQAIKWCGRFQRRGKPGLISRYFLDEEAFRILKVKNRVVFGRLAGLDFNVPPQE